MTLVRKAEGKTLNDRLKDLERRLERIAADLEKILPNPPNRPKPAPTRHLQLVDADARKAA
jgi:hypothetical protein